MHFSKLFVTAALTVLLAACSSSPSDSDVTKIVESQMQQMDAQFAAVGVKFSDVMDINLKVKNKAKQDDGRWLIQTESTLIPKKNAADLTQDQQLTLGLMFGNFKKGQAVGQPQSGTFYIVKGDSGWMATN